MIRRSFLKRMALAAAACAFIDVPWPKPWPEDKPFTSTKWMDTGRVVGDRIYGVVTVFPVTWTGGPPRLSQPTPLNQPEWST